MKKTIFFTLIIVMYLSIMSIIYAVDTNHHSIKDCTLMKNSDSKVNCWKLEKIDRKLNKVLRLLRSDSSEQDYYPTINTEYTCKIKNSSYGFEGYGENIDEATKDAFKSCKTAHFSQSFCAKFFRGCESMEFKSNDHFQCKIKNIKALGETKKEAKARAIQLCSMAYYSKSFCVKSLKKCTFIPSSNNYE